MWATHWRGSVRTLHRLLNLLWRRESDFLKGSTDPGESHLPRSCRSCQQSFEASKYRPDQTFCSQPDCQRRRRTDYHRKQLQTDPEYAQIVRDSQKKWREAHPDYQRRYRQNHAPAVEDNRLQQQRRDRKRRLHHLEKNNLALDLKRSTAGVWLIGPAARDLDRNNLASCQLLIFQPLAPAATLPAAS